MGGGGGKEGVSGTGGKEERKRSKQGRRKGGRKRGGRKGSRPLVEAVRASDVVAAATLLRGGRAARATAGDGQDGPLGL